MTLCWHLAFQIACTSTTKNTGSGASERFVPRKNLGPIKKKKKTGRHANSSFFNAYSFYPNLSRSRLDWCCVCSFCRLNPGVNLTMALTHRASMPFPFPDFSFPPPQK
jgi:hypothetical protein